MMSKENIYVLSVSGYDGYAPTWFRSTRSKTAFKRIVKEAIHNSLKKLTKKDKWGYDFISGHDIKEIIMPLLKEEGFEEITPTLEIDLMGECLYSKSRNDKPSIIARDDWKIILEHNQMIKDDMYKRIMKTEKKKSKKEKKAEAKELSENLEKTIGDLTKAKAKCDEK